MTEVALHYLACRGRGQALRAQLSDAGIDFEDRRHPIDDLQNTWPGEFETGPFVSVPVLHWHGFEIAQLLPAASFVDAKLGHHEGKTPEQIASQQMLTSAAYLDITLPLALMLWQPIVHPGTSLPRTIEVLTARVSTKLGQLNMLFESRKAQNGAFWWGERPSSVDFAVFEAMHTAYLVLQQGLAACLTECSSLRGVETALRVRPRFVECELRAPVQQCGSPVEMQIRAGIAAEQLGHANVDESD